MGFMPILFMKSFPVRYSAVRTEPRHFAQWLPIGMGVGIVLRLGPTTGTGNLAVESKRDEGFGT